MREVIYEYTDYKKYLSVKVTQGAIHEKSYRARLCQHVRCQQSYLSQVINNNPDFTLEQACRLNKFFMHDKQESRYFILLVELSRASTDDLRDFFKEQIAEAKKAQFNLKSRLRETEDVNIKDQHKYYSAWFYSAIHVMLSIPKFQSTSEIAARLNLPEAIVVSALNFLERSGLIENIGGKLHLTKRRIHLDSDSTFIRTHHINWRSQALQSVEKSLADDLHFSSVVTLSQVDFEKVKEIFVKSIEEAREVIKPSPEEEVVAITLDVFKL